MWWGGRVALHRDVLPSAQVYTHCPVPLGHYALLLSFASLSLRSIRSITWQIDCKLCSFRVSGWRRHSPQTHRLVPTKAKHWQRRWKVDSPPSTSSAAFFVYDPAFLKEVSSPPSVSRPTFLSLALFSMPISCCHYFGHESPMILLACLKPGDSRHFLRIYSFIMSTPLHFPWRSA